MQTRPSIFTCCLRGNLENLHTELLLPALPLRHALFTQRRPNSARAGRPERTEELAQRVAGLHFWAAPEMLNESYPDAMVADIEMPLHEPAFAPLPRARISRPRPVAAC